VTEDQREDILQRLHNGDINVKEAKAEIAQLQGQPPVTLADDDGYWLCYDASPQEIEEVYLGDDFRSLI
jgi:hypothetical protein